MNFIEIYPNILVYKNIFENVEKMYQILKESSNDNTDRIFGEWSQWAQFGKYINYPAGNTFGKEWSYENLKEIKTETKNQEDQKYFLLELAGGFDKVTQDYILRYGNDFNFDSKEIVENRDGERFPLWKMYGPSICSYHKDILDKMSMTYHSDFIREPIPSPGYKFAITANAYLNDDYDGGEIDFYVGGELIKYKPEAGDWLVFPSGHPEVLKKNDSVYLHGVFPSSGNEKYFARMYWRKYSLGSEEWFKKEAEFGKKEWYDMQDNINQEYWQTLPNRFEIPEGVRVR
jgi:hypothetical protein